MNKVDRLNKVRGTLKELRERSRKRAVREGVLAEREEKLAAELILDERLLDGFGWVLRGSEDSLDSKYTEHSGGPAYTKRFRETIGKYWIPEWEHGHLQLTPEVCLGVSDGDLYIAADTPEALRKFAKEQGIPLPCEKQCPTCKGRGRVSLI